MINFTVRKADVQDGQSIQSVIEAAIKYSFKKDYAQTPALLGEWLSNKTITNIKKWILNSELSLVALDQRNNIVGFFFAHE